MPLRLALKAVVIGTIILNTTRNIHLHQGDLRYVGGVSLTFAQLGNTSIAAGATNIARRQFLEHLLDDQFVWQRTENVATRTQFYDHSLVSCLQRPLSFILVADDAQQFFAASLELILQEPAPLIRQGRLILLRALLVRGYFRLQGETTPTSKGQHLRSLVFISND